jgi:hypothetical protein
MNQQKWERDIVNQQRNIVFPDTVLNEGRFYRNIFSGKTQLNSTQRIGILLIAATFFFLGCFGLVDPIRSLMISNGGYIHGADIIFGLFWLGALLSGVGLAVKAILPNQKTVAKRRRGYRTSGRT